MDSALPLTMWGFPIAKKLPDKWNALIGENGCELSGGERQRNSTARAFLKDAPIILLDEATPSLDVENETLIQESLSRLIENKTVPSVFWRTDFDMLEKSSFLSIIKLW